MKNLPISNLIILRIIFKQLSHQFSVNSYLKKGGVNIENKPKRLIEPNTSDKFK